MSVNHPHSGISFSLGQVSNTAELEEHVRMAESLGFESVWIPEAWGRDAFTILALLATRTQRITLCTGIINVFSRTPAIVAQSIASLDEISGGRTILGLGASGPRVIESWHGLKFEHVLQRTREYVEVVRLILAGGPVNYDGQVFKLRDFSLAFQPPRQKIPVYLAAIGPANIRLAGEVADGWLPIFASEPFLDRARSWLAEGAVAGGRHPEDVNVAAYIPCLLGPDSPRLLKRQVAYYVGAMGSYYRRLAVRSGFRVEAEGIHAAWAAGRPREAASVVTDGMLKAMTIGRGIEEAREALARFRRMGVNTPVLTVPDGASSADIRATLEALGGY